VNLPTTLSLKCPECRRAVQAPLMRAATILIHRTCRKCRTLWTIRIYPMTVDATKAIHRVEWSAGLS